MLNRICFAAAALVMGVTVGNEANAQNPTVLNHHGWNTGYQVRYLPTGNCNNGACGAVQRVRYVPGVGGPSTSPTICTPSGCYTTPVYGQPTWNSGVQYVPVSGTGCWNGNCQQNGSAWNYPVAWPQGGNGTFWTPVSPVQSPKPVSVPQKFVPQPYLAGSPNQPGSLSRNPFFP